jgi:hypothetical protein
MRAKMEEIVKAQAAELQSHYQTLTDLEEVGSCTSNTALMCSEDEDAWDSSSNAGVTRHEQFVNPDTSTCVRYDLDADGEFLTEPVTGRSICLSSDWDEAGTGFSECSSQGDAEDRCDWSAVEENDSGDWEANTVTKHDAFDAQGCTDPNDIDNCYVNTASSMFGYAIPDDASFSIDDDRPRAEICATNDLVDGIGDYSYASVMEEYPQTAWAWLGMQETGICK